MTQPSGKPAQASAEADSRGAEAEAKRHVPLQLELPAAKEPLEAISETRPERAPLRAPWARQGVAVLCSVVAGLAAVAAAATLWVLPSYVRRQCIELAAEHDVDLAIDGARVDWAGFHLMGLRATSAQIPGAHAQASLMDVETSVLRPRKMTVHGAELTLAGPFGKILADFAKWGAGPLGNQPEDTQDARFALEGARVVWRAPIGENVRVEALGVSAQLQPRELRARSDDVTVVLAGGILGPWRVDVERLATSERVRVALDPGVPEACTVLLVGDRERTTSVDVVVPRSPLTHLGVPAQFFGLDGSNRLQLGANIHYVTLGPKRADATATGGLYGVDLPLLPRPMDVAWEAALTGDANAGIDVRKARLAVGPLVGPLTGTLKRFDDGFRVDLAWAAGPVPCEAFGAPLGLGQPFDIGFALRRLAETSRPAGAGAKRGVSAALMVSFDSRDPSDLKIDFTPQIGCGG